MADLIERSMAISAVNWHSQKCDCIEEIRKIPAVNRWISCSERLPVLYVPVMILTDDGSYAIAHVTGNENEYLWFGDGGHYSKDYVLFWVPLPEPPKGEQKWAE